MSARSAIICKGWEGAARTEPGINEAMPGGLEEDGAVGVRVGVGVGVASAPVTSRS